MPLCYMENCQTWWGFPIFRHILLLLLLEFHNDIDKANDFYGKKRSKMNSFP